ncbi:MAG: chemotaxis protein CheD [Opitutales bacterium]
MGGAPSIGGIFTQRIVVGVGDQAVSNNATATVSTYALGSCVAVVTFDKGTGVGGILHVMLPESKLSPDKARNQPAMFADTGLRVFFRDLQGLGANTRNQRIVLAGGAAVLSGSDSFKIGERNTAAIRQILNGAGLRACFEDVGGVTNRTLHLTLSNGTLEIKMPSGNRYVEMA